MTLIIVINSNQICHLKLWKKLLQIRKKGFRNLLKSKFYKGHSSLKDSNWHTCESSIQGKSTYLRGLCQNVFIINFVVFMSKSERLSYWLLNCSPFYVHELCLKTYEHHLCNRNTFSSSSIYRKWFTAWCKTIPHPRLIAPLISLPLDSVRSLISFCEICRFSSVCSPFSHILDLKACKMKWNSFVRNLTVLKNYLKLLVW